MTKEAFHWELDARDIFQERVRDAISLALAAIRLDQGLQPGVDLRDEPSGSEVVLMDAAASAVEAAVAKIAGYENFSALEEAFSDDDAEEPGA